jgi:chemotaxis protein MotB
MAEKVCPECKQCAEWLNTYGDFVTLLLTFFVLLYSFSSMRTEEFKRGMGSLKGAFGVLPKENALMQKPYVIVPQLTNLQESEIQNSIVKLEEAATDLQLTESVKLQVTEKGVNINIADPVMFDRGRAELKPRILPVLNLVAELSRGWPNKIIIEGHTDNTIISTAQYPTNWELSAARALNVLHYFEDTSGLEPWRLTAIGYGKYHPIAPNDTEANKAKNRRIEIHIEYTGEAPPAGIPVGK